MALLKRGERLFVALRNVSVFHAAGHVAQVQAREPRHGCTATADLPVMTESVRVLPQLNGFTRGQRRCLDTGQKSHRPIQILHTKSGRATHPIAVMEYLLRSTCVHDLRPEWSAI